MIALANGENLTERTFLAWLRTSLSFASIGIAVTQLFRLNTSLKPSTSHASDTLTTLDAPGGLRQVGKPLGATFLAICKSAQRNGTTCRVLLDSTSY